MFISHLPANYLAACTVESLAPHSFLSRYRALAFTSFVVAGIFPDIDMLYFYLIDHSSQHHHLYWTHLPFCWLIAYGIASLTALLIKSKKLWICATSFFLGILLHLFLDTPMGGIAWAYPFSSELYYWTIVPAKYDWWVWNFILHWTFISEIILFVAAVIVYFQRRRKTKPSL